MALATLPFYAYAFKRLRTKTRGSTRQVRSEIADMSGEVQEKVAGSDVVHAFTQAHNETQSFLQGSRRLLGLTMRRAFYQSLNMTISGGLTQLSPLLVTLFGGYRVIQGAMSVGDWVAMSLYLKPLYTPLRRFSQLNVVFANVLAALDRVFEVLDQEPKVKDRPGAFELGYVEGEVAFDRAEFAYPSVMGDGNRPVLREIDFVARPGQRVALVGPSGAGKSTLVSLILRFYDVRGGAVRIDGYDVRDVKVRSLRRHIGMVFRDSSLFSGTVAENLRYGDPEADWDQVVNRISIAEKLLFTGWLESGFGLV